MSDEIKAMALGLGSIIALLAISLYHSRLTDRACLAHPQGSPTACGWRALR